MKWRETNCRTWLLIVPLAFCLLAVGSPVQSDSGAVPGPPGEQYAAFVFGTPVSASDGTTISMSGSIFFSMKNGRPVPGSVTGGGTFDIGAGAIVGTWIATKLEGFHVEGRCGDHPACSAPPPDGAGFPEDFTAGKGTFKILMDEGVGPARFIMWCRLPGIKLPQFSAFPESYRVDIGSLHFDGQEPAGNFFFQLVP